MGHDSCAQSFGDGGGVICRAISLVFFLTGTSYYLYTFINYSRFTNMSALLFITSVLVFLIGLISEQISTLNYKESADD